MSFNPFNDSYTPASSVAAEPCGPVSADGFVLTLEAYRAHDAVRLAVPQGVTRIMAHAFKGHAELEGIELPEGLVEIGPSAFSGCSALREVVIPDSVTTLGDHAFVGCHALERVKLPAQLECIAPSAFAQCENLREIAGGECVAEIGDSAFSGCAALAQLAMLEQAERIGAGAFSGCKTLQQAALPAEARFVGTEAFRNCTRLEHVSMPCNPEELGKNLFSGCTHLEQIDCTDGLIRRFPDAFPRATVEELGLVRPQDLRSKTMAYRRRHAEEIARLESRIAAARERFTALKLERVEAGLFDRAKKKELDAAVEQQRAFVHAATEQLDALQNPTAEMLLGEAAPSPSAPPSRGSCQAEWPD